MTVKTIKVLLGSAMICCCMFTGISVDAQPERGPRMGREQRMERIKAMKVGFITQKLELTTKESEQFWPVYHEFEAEQRKLRQQYMGNLKKDEPKDRESEMAAMQSVEDNLDFQEAMIALKRKYKDRFLKVISAQQVASLYQAEREFKMMLLDRLRDRRRPPRD